MLFILISGLILVALMVYASTRIKKTAAAAFEPETIETDDYVIQKPSGFLHNLNGDPQYEFETYSRELGGDAESIRQGRVRLRLRDGLTIDEAVVDLPGPITEDIIEVIGSRRYRVIETQRTENDSALEVTYKLAEKGGRVYVLEAIRLAETSDEFTRKIEAFVGSFELK